VSEARQLVENFGQTHDTKHYAVGAAFQLSCLRGRRGVAVLPDRRSANEAGREPRSRPLCWRELRHLVRRASWQFSQPDPPYGRTDVIGAILEQDAIGKRGGEVASDLAPQRPIQARMGARRRPRDSTPPDRRSDSAAGRKQDACQLRWRAACRLVLASRRHSAINGLTLSAWLLAAAGSSIRRTPPSENAPAATSSRPFFCLPPMSSATQLQFDFLDTTP
jgi:hypothetical protein